MNEQAYLSVRCGFAVGKGPDKGQSGLYSIVKAPFSLDYRQTNRRTEACRRQNVMYIKRDKNVYMFHDKTFQ